MRQRRLHTAFQASVALQSPGFSQAFSLRVVVCCACALADANVARVEGDPLLPMHPVARSPDVLAAIKVHWEARPSDAQAAWLQVHGFDKSVKYTSDAADELYDVDSEYIRSSRPAAPNRLPFGMFALTKLDLVARMRHLVRSKDADLEKIQQQLIKWHDKSILRYPTAQGKLPASIKAGWNVVEWGTATPPVAVAAPAVHPTPPVQPNPADAALANPADRAAGPPAEVTVVRADPAGSADAAAAHPADRTTDPPAGAGAPRSELVQTPTPATGTPPVTFAAFTAAMSEFRSFKEDWSRFVASFPHAGSASAGRVAPPPAAAPGVGAVEVASSDDEDPQPAPVPLATRALQDHAPLAQETAPPKCSAGPAAGGPPIAFPEGCRDAARVPGRLAEMSAWAALNRAAAESAEGGYTLPNLRDPTFATFDIQQFCWLAHIFRSPAFLRMALALLLPGDRHTWWAMIRDQMVVALERVSPTYSRPLLAAGAALSTGVWNGQTVADFTRAALSVCVVLYLQSRRAMLDAAEEAIDDPILRGDVLKAVTQSWVDTRTVVLLDSGIETIVAANTSLSLRLKAAITASTRPPGAAVRPPPDAPPPPKRPRKGQQVRTEAGKAQQAAAVQPAAAAQQQPQSAPRSRQVTDAERAAARERTADAFARDYNCSREAVESAFAQARLDKAATRPLVERVKTSLERFRKQPNSEPKQ